MGYLGVARFWTSIWPKDGGGSRSQGEDEKNESAKDGTQVRGRERMRGMCEKTDMEKETESYGNHREKESGGCTNRKNAGDQKLGMVKAGRWKEHVDICVLFL